MNYNDSLTYIHSLDKFGSRPGLDRVKMLFDKVAEKYGDVLSQPFVHVAGTNGKGSVCTMLSSIFAENGLKTGLFISPYIVDFRERIQINNKMVEKQDLAEAVSELKPLVDKLNEQGIIITEFEFLTVVGFYIFKKHGCDIIVCEVGMGGLLDSTNLITSPLCSVITRIALDHTAVLGNTIEEIAHQKAGIIKQNGVTVVAKQETPALSVIKSKAETERNPLYEAENVEITATEGADDTRFSYKGEEMLLPLLGIHQLDNLRCVLSTIEALNEQRKMSIATKDIRAGLSEVSHPARFERLSEKPLVILDGAHNPNGIDAFKTSVNTYYKDGDKTLIIGMLADKDNSALDELRGLFKRIIATNIDDPRALPADKLAERLTGLCDSVEVVAEPNVAFDKALSYGKPVFICGSLYLASQIREHILDVLGN